ncbi:MAG: hypothetical protein KKB30_16950 [Proteobacteria bacterium]|nr:hypothetical protein [Pseudomonadota bacterium]
MKKRLFIIIIMLVALYPLMASQQGCKEKEMIMEEGVVSEEEEADIDTQAPPSEILPVPEEETKEPEVEAGETTPPSTEPLPQEEEITTEGEIEEKEEKPAFTQMPIVISEIKLKKPGELTSAIELKLDELRLGEKYKIDSKLLEGYSLGKKSICADEDVMVGIKIRHGDIIDKIVSIKCKPLLKLADKNTAPTEVPINVGGNGGAVSEIIAETGFALNRFSMKELYREKDNKIYPVVGEIAMKEVKVDKEEGVLDKTVAQAGQKFGKGDSNYPWIAVNCPPKYVLKGFFAMSF